MSTFEQLVEIAKSLGQAEQQELLKRAEQLRARSGHMPRRNLKGALSHLGVRMSEDDLLELRREAWKNFPRDLEP